MSSNQIHLQSNLREALLSDSAQYCRSYLAALVTVMVAGDSASSQRVLHSAPLEAPECLDLLLRDLEDQRSGPEFLSQALCAASLLLSRWPQSRFLHILLPILFLYRVPYWSLSPRSPDFLLFFCQSV